MVRRPFTASKGETIFHGRRGRVKKNLNIRGSASVSHLHSYANFLSVVFMCCVLSFNAR